MRHVCTELQARSQKHQKSQKFYILPVSLIRCDHRHPARANYAEVHVIVTSINITSADQSYEIA